MKDLFTEMIERDQEFRITVDSAWKQYHQDHWDEYDDLTKTTIRALYEGEYDPAD